MGQLLLPLFPVDTEYITSVLGVCKQFDDVHYLLSGLPIYSHDVNDLNKFRYITSLFLVQGLCKNCDIVRVFNVSAPSVQRYKKLLFEQGEGFFFKEEARKGKSHKLLPHVLERIQAKLNNGMSNSSIAKEEGISEGSIRYAIKQGALKKNQNQIKKLPKQEVSVLPKMPHYPIK